MLRFRRVLAGRVTVSIVVIAFCATAMFFYLAGEIRGALAWHVLPAAFFGMPESLTAHGLKVLYSMPGLVGWDGQFYYDVANDLRLGHDTLIHIDSPVYRYQRIGLALAANLAALVTFQHWVTPFTYWATNVLLVASGTYALGTLLQRLNLPAPLALLWALGAGIQVTVLNGLPDAAADAFFLLALAFLMGRHLIVYAALMTMAILARETFAVAAGGVFLLQVFRMLAARRSGATQPQSFAHLCFIALPGCALVAWQLFLRFRFGHFPSQEPGIAGALINLPFVGWWQTVIGTFAGHQVYFDGNVPWTERWLEPAHGVLLIGSIAASWVLLTRRQGLALEREIGAALLPFAVLSTTLGPIATGYWTGYLKATSILLVPVIASMARRSWSTKAAVTALLCAYIVVQQGAFWERVKPDDSAAAEQFSSVEAVINKPAKSFPATLPCLGDYRSALALRKIERFDVNPIFRTLLRRRPRFKLDVDVTNTTAKPWAFAQTAGSTNLVGRWVRHDTNEEIGQTRRAVLAEPLLPGQTRRFSLVIDVPGYADRSDLVITMIQDGCAWFSDAGDKGAIRLQLE